MRCLLVLCIVLSAAAARAEEYLKIGSWNIENLGERKYGQHPKAIAEHIQLAGVDVLALQEIHDTDGAAGTHSNKTLDDTCAELNALPGQAWKYLLFPKNEPDETYLLTGLLWNHARIKPVGEPLRIPVETKSKQAWDRAPHAVMFRVGPRKTDLVLVPVHMKSNVTDEGDPKPVDVRAEEARSLVAGLAAVRKQFSGEKDIVILGDTNCKNSQEPAIRSFFDAGFKDLNYESRDTFVTGRSPFDRIFVPQDQREFEFSRQYVLVAADAKKHEGSLSDHFLVLTTVKLLKDDD